MTDVALVVFDLDGTLVDSSLDLANAVNALLSELGATPLPVSTVVSMVGEGARVLVRRALKASGLHPDLHDALDRFLAYYDAHLLDHTTAYTGMLDVLSWIDGRLPMAVLTNKPGYATEKILEGLHVRQHFEHVIGGDTAFGRKPEPAALRHVAAAAGVDPSRVLLVGDSAVDLATARNAGARICLARYGFGYRFAREDFRGDELFIDTPRDLIGMLR
jgi:phosphoglycolate phosphatase